MLFPITCVDNFFNNPEEVVKFANSVEYNKTNQVPGYRSKPIHELDIDFFRITTLKMLSVYFPNTWGSTDYEAYSVFQKTSPGTIDGWVHYDNSFFTSIIYLTHTDVGTSIYQQKKPSLKDLNLNKYEYFSNHENYDEKQLQEVKKVRDSSNDRFEETISFKGKYNRCVQFDGNHYHAAHQQDEFIEDHERLILITFFNKISQHNGRFPANAYGWY